MQSRTGKPVTDAQATDIVRKIIHSNEEAIKMATPPAHEAGNVAYAQKLAEENNILNDLVPQLWNESEIVAFFSKTGNADFLKIREAKSDGQATGVAMKALQAVAAPVKGTDVSAAVRKIRTELP
jgi:uncharacterized protein YqeY